MDLSNKLRLLRKNIRENQSQIIKSLQNNHTCDICIFCATKHNLTKEHILPQWVYDKNPNKFFITNTNGTSQTYNKSVLPCCKTCNNNILGHIEESIKNIFKNTIIGQNRVSYTMVRNNCL